MARIDRAVKPQLRTWLVLGFFLAAFDGAFLVFEELLGPFYVPSWATWHLELEGCLTDASKCATPTAQHDETLLELCQDTKEGEAKADSAKFEKCLDNLRTAAWWAADWAGRYVACERWGPNLPCPRPRKTCIPEGISDEQLRVTYISYALSLADVHSHADKKSRRALIPAYFAANDAFILTWPCKYKNGFIVTDGLRGWDENRQTDDAAIR